jgi:hypothetical protein
MKKAVIIMVTVILAMFFCCEIMATNLQKSIIPAEASWVIHFDLEKFAATQIGNHLLTEEDALGLGKKNDNFLKKYKINLKEDIDGITVFGIGKGDENIVACLQGNFDRDYLLGLLGAEDSHKEIPHGQYTIHNWDGDEYGVFAGEHLVLMGPSEEAIKLALDVIAGKKANIASSPMNEYLKEIPANAFLAALANDISSLGGSKSKMFIIKKTESAMFSLAEIKENFNIRLNFTVKTLEDAQNMENVLRGLISLANMQLEEMKTKFKVPEDVVIATKGKKVYVEMNYPSKALLDIAMGKTKLSALHHIADFNLLP